MSIIIACCPGNEIPLHFLDIFPTMDGISRHNRQAITSFSFGMGKTKRIECDMIYCPYIFLHITVSSVVPGFSGIHWNDCLGEKTGLENGQTENSSIVRIVPVY